MNQSGATVLDSRPIPAEDRVGVTQPVVALPIPATKTDRIQMLDAVRLMAAVLVVWAHCAESGMMKPYRILGTYSVPFYTFVSLFFLARRVHRDPSESLWHYSIARVQRLYLPFLAWTAIYISLKMVKKALGLQNHYPLEFNLAILWDGSTPHLWFLPYLLTLSIVSAVVFRLVAVSSILRMTLSALLVAGGFYVGSLTPPAWFADAYEQLEFSAQIWRVAPTALLALGTMLLWPQQVKVKALPAWLGILAILIVVVAAGFELSLGNENLILRAVCGFGLFLLAFSPFRGKVIEWFGRYGRLSYGIYLSHHLFLAICQTAAVRFLDHRGPRVDLLMLPTIFFLSLGFCIMMSKWKPTRMLIGGGAD